jgi:hypothetical protein
MMIRVCDFCGEQRECRSRQIEGLEYDFCNSCWKPLQARLAGKGRPAPSLSQLTTWTRLSPSERQDRLYIPPTVVPGWPQRPADAPPIVSSRIMEWDKVPASNDAETR